MVVFDAKNKGTAGYAQVPPKESLTNAPTGSIKIAITNSSSFKQYHCALAYLGQLFDIVTDTLWGASVLVEPGATVFASVPLPNAIVPNGLAWYKKRLSTNTITLPLHSDYCGRAQGRE